jgi:hypothetical protein
LKVVKLNFYQQKTKLLQKLPPAKSHNDEHLLEIVTFYRSHGRDDHGRTDCIKAASTTVATVMADTIVEATALSSSVAARASDCESGITIIQVPSPHGEFS